MNRTEKTAHAKKIVQGLSESKVSIKDAREVCDIAKEIINYSVVSPKSMEEYRDWFEKPNYIPSHHENNKAERINEQLSEGKISINQARKECGLKPIEDGDFITQVKKDSRERIWKQRKGGRK